ncbi:Uncharacterized protein dnl_44270 [Desulfonema limicola]|uniref:Uncharacterized protein n=1 Tax=Desulfonema limicola TaxID=45656 RepID=A0A975GIL4_9BACT|nr:hypothetical protein [Desulfonema limicola]QTA82063.1 Uncharacterized protein dnl_44270 [Desulfonema limicola]
MNIMIKSLNDINIEAINLLNSSLGIADTIRFLNQFTTGFGNYTEEREKIFDKMSLEDIVAEIKQMRKG